MLTIYKEGDRILYAPCIGDCTKCPVKHRAVIYGPVKSRRRGRSLGINPFPKFKVCSFDCIYCLRGRTVYKVDTPEKAPLQIDVEDILKILEKVLREVETDTIDLSGNGEPTLYPKIGELCREISKICREYSIKSFGIFTNSTTLKNRNIINALKYLDHIEAKLDTGIEDKLYKINRPIETIKIRDIIEGLKNLRNINAEKVIQILLFKYYENGIELKNYTSEDAEKIVEILRIVEPDYINIYTIYRPVETRYKLLQVTYEEVYDYVKVLESNGFKVRLFLT